MLKNNSKTFFDFLESDRVTCEIKDDQVYEIMKIPFGFNLDLLYGDHSYGDHFGIYNKLYYIGVYNRESKELYDLDYLIRNQILGLSWEDRTYKIRSEIFEEISNQVKEIITDYVNENKEDFYSAVKENYQPYICERDIYRYFIEDIKKIEYKSNYETDNSDVLLNYLDRGLDYLYEVSLEYITLNKERIGEKLVDLDMSNELLNGIYINPKHKLHKVKDIINSLKDIDYINVRVFINKDDKDLDFKCNRQKLLLGYYQFYLSIFDIALSDRKKYQEVFGKWNDFYYEDITKIEFKGKILYEDKKFNKCHLDENGISGVDCDLSV